MENKIKTRPALIKILEDLKSMGNKIVTTGGAFDILHAGHVRSFERAKQYGDILVVMVNTDESVMSYKGPKRPLNKEKDRALMVAALEVVDYVVMFNESTPAQILDELRPNVHCKAADYNVHKMPETPTVKKYHGDVIAVPLEAGYGNSDLIQEILNKFGDSDASKMDSGRSEFEVGKDKEK